MYLVYRLIRQHFLSIRWLADRKEIYEKVKIGNTKGTIRTVRG